MRAATLSSLGLLWAVLVAGAPASWAEVDPGSGPEDAPRRQGFAFGIGVGSAATRSFGIPGVGGPGGAATLHVGTTASARMLWILQLDVAADPHVESRADGDQTILNQHVMLTLGAQHYAREFVWVKAGAGLAALVLGRDPQADADTGQRTSGLGLMAAGGYDLVRSGMFALSLEAGLNIGAFADGAVTSLATRLSANWY